jgi:LmbE family N-acetylglucosaminyl deacetylase
MSRSRTVVFVHAHPDDEVFLTGGTMARLSAEGHRVALITATNGERGLAADDLAPDGELGAVRASELARSARALGCHEVYPLGYPDSGLQPSDGAPDVFSRLPVEALAAQVGRLLTDLRADIVCGYDRAGGYGHPDHVQVHHVTRRAAQLAHTRLIEATVNRLALKRLLRVAAPLLPAEPQYRPASITGRFSHPSEISHVVRVGRYVAAKRDALAEHASQAGGGDERRLAAILLRLPGPLCSVVLGREWFIEDGHPRPARLPRLFASARQ